ncbi:hypothetical protein IV57_GL001433 [Companilactobacillus kimchiensis]|uniref:Uncharacterized protein n=1 Tax=Companilactobacillus kimchiensis TaxID=993692 RepID=A0A0R2LPQ2_9LACO|nr:hypothetical protein IV57_GL001433 [Companilactobacillus kimchiensis]
MGSLYLYEPFEVDNQIIALLDISQDKDSRGNSLVVHERLGVFFDSRTTKELVNEFYKINGTGFATGKILSGIFKLRHTPFVFAYVSYMPMTGGSRKNVDWIGLQFIDRYSQKEKFAHFVTVHGFEIKLSFPRGDLEKRIHDVCMLSEKSVLFFEKLLTGGLAELKPSNITGVLRRFEKCECLRHKKIVRKVLNINSACDKILKYLLTHMGVEEPEAETLISFYRQNINKCKKLY